MRTHKDLIVWQKSIELVKLIYKETQLFPKEELFGLVSQMRRAAVSIPSNIAEGYGRESKKECRHFVYISLGSASELETQLIIAKELDFMKEEAYICLISIVNEVIRMLSSLIKSLNENISCQPVNSSTC